MNFVQWWQHIPEHLNPNLISIGSFHIRYYGLMYIIAFTISYLLILYRMKHEDYNYSNETLEDYFMWGILSIIIGARLGYVLFYNLPYYLAHPIEIISPVSFQGGFHFTGIAGMSYHGAVIGVILVSIFYFKKHQIDFWNFADLVVPTVPLGYTFGRLGNFINGELYGRVTSTPWGMYFPLDQTHQLRHPSQLYEATFEGLFLFILLWSLRKVKVFDGFLFALYLIGYGTVRFFIEFFRQPDVQLGFVLGPFSMGQLLCFAMILTGLVIIGVRTKQTAKA